MNFLTFVDLNKNELRNARMQNLGIAPINPVAGQIFFNAATLTIWCFNGTIWEDIGGMIKNIVKATGSPLTVTIANGIATLDIVAATQTLAGSMSAADKLKLDSSASSNIASTLVQRDSSGNVILNQLTATKVTGLSAGVNPSDAVTKSQLDAVASGLDAKGSVRVATTSVITLSATQTIDGVAVAVGDRVLVKNQGSAVANGVYIVAASTWTRASDLATAATAKGAYFFINEGAVNGDTGWLCISDGGSDVVGTNPLSFTQFTSTGTITGGAGLLKTGNTLDIVSPNNSINILPDGIQTNPDNVTIYTMSDGKDAVKDGGITAAKIATSAVDGTMVGGGGVPIGVKGHNFVTGTTLSRVHQSTQNIGGGVGVAIVHNLNSKGLTVQIWSNATGEMLIADVANPTLNTTTITALGATISVLVSIQG